jgi:hypothetical protein
MLSIVLLCVAVSIVATSALLYFLPFYGNTLSPYDSARNPVNLIFRFGVTGSNELNTFHGTFTKDLCIDGTITTRLVLSEAELKQIQKKLNEVDFFSLPESYPLREPLTAPDYSYYLMVQNGNTIKEVSWGEANSVMDSSTEAKLSEIAGLLTDLIAQKPEYQRLPPQNGMYL